MPQLKIPCGATKIDILYTATKTRHSQMNTLKKNKKHLYSSYTAKKMEAEKEQQRAQRPQVIKKQEQT